MKQKNGRVTKWWLDDHEYKKLHAEAEQLKDLKAERRKEQRKMEKLEEDLKAERREGQEKMEKLEEDLEAERKEQEKLKKLVEDLKAERKEKQDEIRKFLEGLRKEQGKVKKLVEAERRKKQEEMEKLEEDLEAERKEQEKMKKLVEDLKAERRGKQEEMEKRMEDLEAERREEQKEMEKLKEAKEFWESESDLYLKSACDEWHEKNEAKKRLSELQEDSQSQCKSLQNERQSLNTRCSELSQKCQKWETKCQSLQSKIKQLEENDTKKLVEWTSMLESLKQHILAVPKQYVKICPKDSIENPEMKAQEASAAIARHLFNLRQLHKPEVHPPIVDNVFRADASKSLDIVKLSAGRAVMELGALFERFVPQEEREGFHADLSLIFTAALSLWSDIRRHEYQIVVNDGVPDQLEDGWEQKSPFEEYGGTDRICFFPKVLIYPKKHSATICGKCYIPQQQVVTPESSEDM